MRGHIRQRSKDSYELTVAFGRDPVTGKRQQLTKTVRTTNKRVAERALTAWLSAIDNGTELDAEHLTVAEFTSKWLEAVKPRLAPTTHERYERLFRLQVVPTVGRIQLSRLRPLHLEHMYAALLESGLSPQSVLHVHRVTFSALRQGVKWQLVARNVAEAVDPPRPGRREVHAITPLEATAVMAMVAGTDLEMPVVLALGTGMRRGEVLGLRWSDIDLEAGRARVVQTIQHVNRELVFVPPKTHRSRRPVSLPAFVVEALRAHKAAQNERRLLLSVAWQETGLVVDRGDGSPMRPDSLTTRFKKVTARAGMDLGFHGLRHAHASLMLAAGVHLKVVSDRLGHSTIGITADLYSHVSPALEEGAAATLDALLGGSSAEGR